LLEHLQLNFNKVEKLRMNIPSAFSLQGKPVYSGDEYLKYIFSFANEKQNLKQFELSASFQPLKAETLDILKMFPNLKSLSITSCPFENVFTLTLNNLEEVCFKNCKNIAFDENRVFKLKKIDITDSEIIKPKSIISLSDIEEVKLDSNSVNYFNCLKPKNVSTTLYGLKKINISSAENLTILENNRNETENIQKIEKEVIEKILDCNQLKVIELKTNLNDEQISSINKINYSVTKIKFRNDDGKIYNNFLKKFENLTEFEFLFFRKEVQEKNIFKIREDKSSKINKIDIKGAPEGILYCNSFENLNSIILNLSFGKGIQNISNILPLFNNICKIKFKSLDYFYLQDDEMNDEILNNLQNNLDFISNDLSVFFLNVNSKKISKQCYYDFIKKSLKKFNKQLFIKLSDKGKEELTKEEIGKIVPEVDLSEFDNLSISRY
jgi:hypothetical protein